MRELTGNLVLRWFVGLDLDQRPWDHSIFPQNRKRRFTETGLLERLFDETVALAITPKSVSHLTTLDGTLVQANASHKSFVPMEVFLKPAEYKQRIRSLDGDAAQDQDPDPGNPTVTFRGERRSNQRHVSMTDLDTKLANKGHGTAALVGSTVNGWMEHRHRLLLGINVESFRGPASEMDGGRELLDRFHATQDRRIQTVGADKGYWAHPVSDRPRAMTHYPAYCPQDDRTRGDPSAGAGAASDGRRSPLATGAKEDRRIVGRGEMLAGVPAVSATGAAAGARRSVSDGVVAQSEATGEPAPA